MLEDYLVPASAAVAAAFVVLAALLLAKYRSIASDINKSNTLAKDIWDALDVRLKKQDERIIDLMAKTDVYSARSSQGLAATQVPPKTVSDRPRVEETRSASGKIVIPSTSAMPTSRVSTSTEKQILQILSESPRPSTEISRLIAKSREHTARLMKSLFEDGYVTRDDSKKPFLYQVTEAGRNYLLGTGSG